MKVIVTSASTLEPKTADSLRKAIIKKHGQDAEFEFRVDPAVIGGIKIVVGSKAVDMTVTGRLAQVKQQLLNQL